MPRGSDKNRCRDDEIEHFPDPPAELQSTFGEANPSCGVLRLSVCSEMLGLGVSHHREGQDYAKVGTVSPQG